MNLQQLETEILAAWEARTNGFTEEAKTAIREALELIDLGKLRIAEPTDSGWKVNQWAKMAVLMYFQIQLRVIFNLKLILLSKVTCHLH